MHSRIFTFCTEKDSKLQVSYNDIEGIQSINCDADYIGENFSAESTLADCYSTLMSIFPPFIKIDKSGTIQVSPNSRILFHKWIELHISRVRKWQDAQYKQFGRTYVYGRIDIVTEGENSKEWDDFCSIFNIYYEDEEYKEYSNYFCGYTAFIETLACDYENKTLYLVGSTDYHY